MLESDIDHVQALVNNVEKVGDIDLIIHSMNHILAWTTKDLAILIGIDDIIVILEGVLEVLRGSEYDRYNEYHELFKGLMEIKQL